MPTHIPIKDEGEEQVIKVRRPNAANDLMRYQVHRLGICITEQLVPRFMELSKNASRIITFTPMTQHAAMAGYRIENHRGRNRLVRFK